MAGSLEPNGLRPIEEYIAAYKEREDMLRNSTPEQIFALWLRLEGKKQAFVNRVRLGEKGGVNAIGEFSLSLVFIKADGSDHFNIPGTVSDKLWNPKGELNCTIESKVIARLCDGVFRSSGGSGGSARLIESSEIPFDRSRLDDRELITV